MKYCIYCGSSMPDEARFCPSCGKEVEKTTADLSKPEVAPTPALKTSSCAPQKKSHGGLIAFLVIAILASVGVGGYFLVKNAYFNTATTGAPGNVTKRAPSVSASQNTLGTKVTFLLHANDNYDYVAVSYKIIGSDSSTLRSDTVSWTTLTKGLDYSKEIDVSSYLFSWSGFTYRVAEYR